MNTYQFRTNLLGQLVLQRRVRYTTGSIGWEDAKAPDLADYYAELYVLRTQAKQNSTQRELFELECG
jgi:hypothetical protein